MFVNRYKHELEKQIKELEKELLDHWKAHKKPLWAGKWKTMATTTNQYELELIVATAWILQGAKGCSCYDNPLTLYKKATNYFIVLGAIETCNIIIQEMVGEVNYDQNKPITGPRKLMLDIYKAV